MAQFDIHRNTGRQKAVVPYVVVVQSRRFDGSSLRVVLPLLLESFVAITDARLTPGFEIEGMRVVLDPLQTVSIPVDRLGAHVGSLKAEGDRITAAIDWMITRAFD